MLPRPQNRQTPIPVNARFAASRCVNFQEEPRDTRRLDFKDTSHLRSFVVFPTYTFYPPDSSSEKKCWDPRFLGKRIPQRYVAFGGGRVFGGCDRNGHRVLVMIYPA